MLLRSSLKAWSWSLALSAWHIASNSASSWWGLRIPFPWASTLETNYHIIIIINNSLIIIQDCCFVGFDERENKCTLIGRVRSHSGGQRGWRPSAHGGCGREWEHAPPLRVVVVIEFLDRVSSSTCSTVRQINYFKTQENGYVGLIQKRWIPLIHREDLTRIESSKHAISSVDSRTTKNVQT